MVFTVRATFISGNEHEYDLPERVTVRDLRQILRENSDAPFVTLLGEKGELLEMDRLLALQLPSMGASGRVQVIVQRPTLSVTTFGAAIWCPHNPFLDTHGDAASGGVLPFSQANLPPIRSVLGVYSYFVAVTERDKLLVWGDAPSVFSLNNLAGPLEDIVAEMRSVALRYPGGRVDVWNTGTKGRCRDRFPVCRWTDVVVLKASQFAIVAILTSGEIIAHGCWHNGGMIPEQVQEHVAKAKAEDILVATRSICVKCADGSAAIWGRMAANGIVIPALSARIVEIKASRAAFAALWDDGTVSAWGDSREGGDCSDVQHHLQNVLMIGANNAAFAAITKTKIISWGYSNNCICDSPHLVDPAYQIYNNDSAFALLLTSGTVKVWGNPHRGGKTWLKELHGVTDIKATAYAFAAIHLNGTISTWGNPYYGGDSDRIQAELREIVWVRANRDKFFAYRADDTLVFWGAMAGTFSYHVVKHALVTTPHTVPPDESIEAIDDDTVPCR